MSQCPVFVFAACQRTGSTYAARLLTSTGDILVWREHDPFAWLRQISVLPAWTLDEDNGENLYEFRSNKANMTTPTLGPFRDDLERTWCEMMEQLYGGAAMREGFARWGIKTGAWVAEDVEVIRRQWRDYRLVFLHREWNDVYRSAVGMESWPGFASDAERLHAFAERWVYATRFMLQCVISPKERVFTYRELCESPQELAHWCGISSPIKELTRSLSTSMPYIPEFAERAVCDILPRIERATRECEMKFGNQ